MADRERANQRTYDRRLDRAKLKIRDFVEAHATARIGLIAFAGSAHTVVQPTRNGAAILLNLERLRTSIMPVL